MRRVGEWSALIYQLWIWDNAPVWMLRTAAENGSVINPVVIVKASGIKCRAFLDSGAGSSYASAVLLDRLNKRPRRRCITVNKMTKVYDLEIGNLKGDLHSPKLIAQFCWAWKTQDGVTEYGSSTHGDNDGWTWKEAGSLVQASMPKSKWKPNHD